MGPLPPAQKQSATSDAIEGGQSPRHRGEPPRCVHGISSVVILRPSMLDVKVTSSFWHMLLVALQLQLQSSRSMDDGGNPDVCVWTGSKDRTRQAVVRLLSHSDQKSNKPST